MSTGNLPGSTVSLTGLGRSDEGRNAVRLGLGTASAFNLSAWRDTYVGGATITLSDPEEPTIVSSGDSAPAEWTNGGSFTVRPEATDPGLGLKSLELSVPGEPVGGGATQVWTQTRTHSCTARVTEPCPESWTLPTATAEDFEYSTDDVDPGTAGSQQMPEGVNTLKLKARDPVHDGATSEWEVKVDRSPPDLSLSGALKDQEGQELSSGTHRLTIQASDGAADGGPHQRRSGVADLRVQVNGEDRDGTSQECPTGSCSLSHDFDFDTVTADGGEHEIKVTATDAAGNETSQSFSVRSPCCFEPTSSSTGSTLYDDVTFGDLNADGVADAAGETEVSGEPVAAISTSDGFESWQPYGDPAAFDGIPDPQLADVNGDDFDDLVGRNSVSGEVTVAENTGQGFEEPEAWGSTPSTADVSFADVDGDEQPDLVSRDATSDEIKVGISNGQEFGTQTVWATVQADSQVAFGDVDADGSADLVRRDPQSGALTVSSSTGESFGAPASWGTIAGAGDIQVEDMNGDLAADAVLRDPATATVK
ncbi:MAG: VCBS repeat-containing protein, partial [Actinomycetota bacterium]|nr:VCBS repeat-containing protein [Actinomycetota bacterium]